MAQPPHPDSHRKYEAFADKVGLVPNVRAKDNLYQGLAVVAFALLGTAVGFFVTSGETRSSGLGLGALVGVIVGGLLSGLVLMVIGLRRKA
jgi:hypothetical protein